MKNCTFLFFVIFFLASCSSNEKKILVMSRGIATIDKDAKTITATSQGNNHEEQTIAFNTSDKISLHIKSQAGEGTIDIPENGYYVLNAKNDTIVGSYQKYSTPEEANRMITQEELKRDIDSLQQLIQNKNVSAANRNFFLPPNSAAKISDNTDAFVVGPFHQMTSIAKEGDKEPEVYRFYNIGEIRATIEKLQKLTH